MAKHCTVIIEDHYLPHRKSPGVNWVNAREGIDVLSFPEAAVTHPRVSGDWHVSVGDTSVYELGFDIYFRESLDRLSDFTSAEDKFIHPLIFKIHC